LISSISRVEYVKLGLEDGGRKVAKSTILSCPVCGGRLEAVRLACTACDTSIEGHFATSPFGGLSAEQQEFVKVFLSARGNISLVERQLGISYPTVRNRLEGVQKAMGLVDIASAEEKQERTTDILSKLASGELSVDEAIDSLD
jgi:hypothetical protein